MFTSDEQLARVCRAFCARVRMPELWGNEGPTEEAVELLESEGGPLSSDERIVLMIAWSLWNGRGHVTVADVLHRLDGASMAMLGSLLLAAANGSNAIDAWITETEATLGPTQNVRPRR